jgi:hypothetical protein
MGSSANDLGSNAGNDLGSSDLGSLTNDRTNLGATTVSSGSMTDTGRADFSGGMSTGTGPTTASSSSMAGSGELGGGPSDLGGQATTLDLGSTPHGSGTGRGAGDAYGSSVVTTGGPHSYAMPMPAEDISDSAPTAGTGEMTSSNMASGSDDMPTARADQGAMPGVDYAGTADRDTADPAADATVGGTGANYSGGTGGWGTEDPNSSGAAGWQPGTGNSGGGSETH